MPSPSIASSASLDNFSWAAVSNLSASQTIDGPYSLVSSFYGPGSIGCWLFTLASLFLTWTWNLDFRDRDIITNDMIAALAIPSVAAVHFHYQFFSSTYDPGDVLLGRTLAFFAAANALEAPLAICETYMVAALALFAVAASRGHVWRAACVLVSGLLAFSANCVLFFETRTRGISLDTCGFVRPYAFDFAAIMGSSFGFLLSCAIGYGILVMLLRSTAGGSALPSVERSPTSASKGISILSVLSLPIVIFTFLASAIGTLGNTYRGYQSTLWERVVGIFIPRSDVSLSDLDQFVALAVGIIAFCFNLLDIWKSRHKQSDHMEHEGATESGSIGD